MKLRDIKSIIWDWNGTLLDDRDVCISSINRLLADRKLEILSKEKYLEIFTFPVKDYYIRAGFDFSNEDWDHVAIEFIDLYKERVKDCIVFPETKSILTALNSAGLKLFLVSAMEHEFLLETVGERGLLPYFEYVSGIQDHFAESKLSIARKLISEYRLEQDTTMMIGDTVHDFEVAENLGVRCLLVSQGHQSLQRLKVTECPVVSNLNEILDYLEPLLYLETEKNTFNENR